MHHLHVHLCAKAVSQNASAYSLHVALELTTNIVLGLPQQLSFPPPSGFSPSEPSQPQDFDTTFQLCMLEARKGHTFDNDDTVCKPHVVNAIQHRFAFSSEVVFPLLVHRAQLDFIDAFFITMHKCKDSMNLSIAVLQHTLLNLVAP